MMLSQVSINLIRVEVSTLTPKSQQELLSAMQEKKYPITGQSDILQMKTFHPLDDWYGMAATEPAAREIDTSNASTEWNKNLLDKQARPGLVYKIIPGALDFTLSGGAR